MFSSGGLTRERSISRIPPVAGRIHLLVILRLKSLYFHWLPVSWGPLSRAKGSYSFLPMVPSLGRSHMAVCLLKARKRMSLLFSITFVIVAGSKSQVLSTLKGRELGWHWYDPREQRSPTILECCLPQPGYGSFLQWACTVAGETRLTLLNQCDRKLNASMASRKKFLPPHPGTPSYLSFNNSDKD